MTLTPRVTEVERLLFCSDVVAIGAFRCPSRHPLFVDSGPASGHLVVFPRSSTTIVFDGGRTVTGASPTVLFYNRGQAYTRKKIDDIDASDWFMIAPDIVREAVPAAADREDRLFPFYVAPASAKTYLEQRTLHTALSDGRPIDALTVEETVMGLLDDVIAAARRDKLRDSIEAVKALIASRPAANMSLRALASHAGCSPFQLCRTFRAATGQTITEYRHALRLRLALNALRDTRAELTDIALDTGYSSHSHFTMAFRRRFGITPSAYRHLRRL
ncbi:MAG TPA: AraC family transcriptional regulator [Thermoanaerobaculia bacterium]|nr:AraC family transcriptional regulator [Thermoanaerobaculia bacterium]